MHPVGPSGYVFLINCSKSSDIVVVWQVSRHFSLSVVIPWLRSSHYKGEQFLKNWLYYTFWDRKQIHVLLTVHLYPYWRRSIFNLVVLWYYLVIFLLCVLYIFVDLSTESTLIFGLQFCLIQKISTFIKWR